jgi:cation diffusion facilitator family transporter
MPGYDWSDDGYFVTETRDVRQIRRVLIVTMLLNFVATAIKLTAGAVTGSLSVVADGLDSLFDGLSNVVGLAGLYVAAKPPDAEHPYGHRKFETIAALSISFLLFLTCWQLLLSAWDRLSHGTAPHVNIWTGIAMVASMLVQAGTSYYELNAGRRLKSEILTADAMHTRASILVSLSVLVGLGFVKLGFPQADPLFAVVVAIMIAKIGIDILRETLPVLVDRAVVDPRKIAEVVAAVGGVESFHRVRSRGAEGSAAVDLHVRLSPDMTIRDADAIGNEIRRRLLTLDGVNDVTVHLEAQRGEAANATDILGAVKHAADESGLTVHESWVQRVEGELYVEVHIGVDPRLSLGEAHSIVDDFEKEVRERLPEVKQVHTHIEMADKQVQEGDRAPFELEQRVRHEVTQIIAGIPSLDNPHNIIVRRNQGTEQDYFVSLECTIDSDTPIADAHHLSSIVEHELGRRLDGIVEVSVHLEPPGQP